MNFLLHEMPVNCPFPRISDPWDVLNLRLDLHTVQGLDVKAVALDDGHLTALEEADFPGMFNNRGQVAGDEHFVVAFADSNPAAFPSRAAKSRSGSLEDMTTMPWRALNAFHRHFYGFGEVLSDCVVAFDQINNRFGVGLRLKQPRPQPAVHRAS
jgi:hypothetical protein